MPVTVAGGHSFASVCSGFVHSCALEPSGKAWCWGYNHDDNAIDEPDTTSTTTPVEVPSNLTFRSITCGGYHTCALDDGGQAWCWGSNGDGQLGTNGFYFYEPEAAAIPWLNGEPVAAARHTFKALSAGALHTCGIAEFGTAVCWGRSYDGQLGDNSTFVSEYGSTEPVDVAGGHTFRSIACGYSHTCALDDSGKAWCWGDGSVGQLGNGAAVDSMLPVPVLGNRTYVVIEVGEAHTCAITEAGAMWCWGRAVANGQTGYINEPAEVCGGHKFVAASSAGGFTCALDVAGDVWCFGRNWIGQLGNGGYRSSTLPVKVASSHASFLALGQGTSNTLCAVSTKQASSGG
ncbi:hypothetical protein COHA_004220 [Chlorella ohadii]|uniref:RCC1 repeat-containing protein n=1 Tax=Chlorella ohadii TaxID=2649997 RepID=A0AAD5DTB1_9CHLO|nr:hypothetical protein COHA_004220 [Chlorella ohadii]